MTKTKKARGIDGDAFLAAQLSDPRVRHHFEQRRIVHEVAVAVRGMRMGAASSRPSWRLGSGQANPRSRALKKGSTSARRGGTRSNASPGHSGVSSS